MFVYKGNLYEMKFEMNHCQKSQICMKALVYKIRSVRYNFRMTPHNQDVAKVKFNREICVA